MAKAYLQGQGQKRESEPEPAESARPDGPHRYRYPQKRGHHHHHVPPADDVHGLPHLRFARREQHQGERWQGRRRKPVEQRRARWGWARMIRARDPW